MSMMIVTKTVIWGELNDINHRDISVAIYENVIVQNLWGISIHEKISLPNLSGIIPNLFQDS